MLAVPVLYQNKIKHVDTFRLCTRQLVESSATPFTLCQESMQSNHILEYTIHERALSRMFNSAVLVLTGSN
jgi:hypothetical protein